LQQQQQQQEEEEEEVVEKNYKATVQDPVQHRSQMFYGSSVTNLLHFLDTSSKDAFSSNPATTSPSSFSRLIFKPFEPEHGITACRCKQAKLPTQLVPLLQHFQMHRPVQIAPHLA
jgi:hypothetical protein